MRYIEASGEYKALLSGMQQQRQGNTYILGVGIENASSHVVLKFPDSDLLEVFSMSSFGFSDLSFNLNLFRSFYSSPASPEGQTSALPKGEMLL